MDGSTSAAVPCTMDDANVRIGVGAAVWEVVDQLVKDGVIDAVARPVGAILVASFFFPMLARETRIARFMGLPLSFVANTGKRLRRCHIWVGDTVHPQRLTAWHADSPQANIDFTLDVMVGTGIVFCWFESGDFRYALSENAPPPPVTYFGESCVRCGGTERYWSTSTCAPCARNYQRTYSKKGKHNG